MDTLLAIIVAVVVVGVGLAVLKFVIAKWLPDFQEYFNIIVMVAMAALFVWCLYQVWPYLSGWGGGRSRARDY